MSVNTGTRLIRSCKVVAIVAIALFIDDTAATDVRLQYFRTFNEHAKLLKPSISKLRDDTVYTLRGDSNIMSTKTKQQKMSNFVSTSDNTKKRANNNPNNMESKKPKIEQVDLNTINFDTEKKSSKNKAWNIKMITWNVAGLRACFKKNITEYLLKEDADIMCFQEIKCREKQLPDVAKLEGYTIYINSAEKAGYSGVALYTKKKPINVRMGLEITEIIDDEGRVIEAEYETFYLVSAYIPNAGAALKTLPKRLKWDDEFRSYLAKLDTKKPVILTGDLNVAHKEIDIANPKSNLRNPGFTIEERENMSKFLNLGFIDIFRELYPKKTDAYTFWSYFSNSRARNIGWRLDYFITSKRFMENMCDSVIRSGVKGSDHCPVVLFASI